MLRVFVFEEPYTVTLRLEGEVTAETAPSLVQRWADVGTVLMKRRVMIDMGDVVKIDESGHRMLKWLSESGASFRNVASGFRSALEDIICGEDARPGARKRFSWILHRLGCGHEPSSSGVCRRLCSLLPLRVRPCECRGE